MFACAKIAPGHLIAQAQLLFHDYTRQQYNYLKKKHMKINAIFIVL